MQPADSISRCRRPVWLGGLWRRLGLPAILALVALRAFTGTPAAAEEPPAPERRPRIAAIVTSYYHNSHADMLVGRLLEGNALDGRAPFPRLELVSLYIDQTPDEPAHFRDVGRAAAARHNVPVYESVAGALGAGREGLAVDGVLLIAEHGQYPLAPDGQIQYPKRRLWDEVVRVFESSGRAVPVFHDKHLADTWQDARWIYDASRRLGFPLMAGSSVPVTWRRPAAEVSPGARLKEVLVLNYGPIEGYGFHALEALESLVEKRRGGETGVRAVRFLTGEAAWQAIRPGAIDRELLDRLLAALHTRPWPAGKSPEEIVGEPPVLFQIDYRDGLRASVLTLDWHVAEWAAAWRDADTSAIDLVTFETQEERPLMHFSYLLDGIERMMHTGRPTWPVERTLLTTGVLDALFDARPTDNWLETPQLDVAYQTDWRFVQPPPAPPGRPLDGP